MTDMTEAQIQASKQALEAMAQDPQGIEVTLTKLQAWALMSTIQLAYRHPLFNHNWVCREAANVARGLQELLAAEGPLAQLAELGWQIEQDQDEEEEGIYQ